MSSHAPAACADLSRTTGSVFRVPSEEADEIWAYLDHREKDGYTMRTVDVYGLGENGEEIVVEKDVS
jgi:glutathione-specific gamma-glutamylcyclotransferase